MTDLATLLRASLDTLGAELISVEEVGDVHIVWRCPCNIAGEVDAILIKGASGFSRERIALHVRSLISAHLVRDRKLGRLA